MTPTEKHREPDVWRYRYEHKPGVWGKWTVQKNKPALWRPEQPDVQVEPLFSEAALAKAEREGMKRAAEIARGSSGEFDFQSALAEGRDFDYGFHNGKNHAADSILAAIILSEAGEG